MQQLRDGQILGLWDLFHFNGILEAVKKMAVKKGKGKSPTAHHEPDKAMTCTYKYRSALELQQIRDSFKQQTLKLIIRATQKPGQGTQLNIKIKLF